MVYFLKNKIKSFFLPLLHTKENFIFIPKQVKPKCLNPTIACYTAGDMSDTCNKSLLKIL